MWSYGQVSLGELFKQLPKQVVQAPFCGHVARYHKRDSMSSYLNKFSGFPCILTWLRVLSHQGENHHIVVSFHQVSCQEVFEQLSRQVAHVSVILPLQN